MKNVFNNPGKIYLVWIIMFVIFCLLIPFLSNGHNGGEQMGFILLGFAFNDLIYGLLIISVITSAFFRTWFKSYWYINVVVIIIMGALIISVTLLNGRAPRLW